MKFLLRGLVSFFLISLFSVTKQAFVKQPCEYFNVSSAENFDAEKYLGRWYVFFLYDYKEILGLDCIIWNYNNMTKGDTSYVFETSKNLRTGQPQFIQSEMKFSRFGKGEYTYDITTDTTDPEYIIVISTDYYTYAVEWSCVEKENLTECFVYAITRKDIPAKETIATINDIVKQHNIDLKLARYIKQGAECKRKPRPKQRC